MKIWSNLLAAFTLCLVAVPALSQDITGVYDLTVAQDPGADDCIWEGSLNLVQSGGNPGSFTGSAAVTLVSGGGLCTDFAGTVSGSISGSTLTIGVGVSGLGTATFTGSVIGPEDIAGSWSGLGLTGTWSASRASASAIPATPAWALAGLTLLIAWFGRRHLRKP